MSFLRIRGYDRHRLKFSADVLNDASRDMTLMSYIRCAEEQCPSQSISCPILSIKNIKSLFRADREWRMNSCCLNNSSNFKLYMPLMILCPPGLPLLPLRSRFLLSTTGLLKLLRYMWEFLRLSWLGDGSPAELQPESRAPCRPFTAGPKSSETNLSLQAHSYRELFLHHFGETARLEKLKIF